MNNKQFTEVRGKWEPTVVGKKPRFSNAFMIGAFLWSLLCCPIILIFYFFGLISLGTPIAPFVNTGDRILHILFSLLIMLLGPLIWLGPILIAAFLSFGETSTEKERDELVVSLRKRKSVAQQDDINSEQ